MSDETVKTIDGYEIWKDWRAGQYHVDSPTGELLFGNRPTLEEAESDLRDLIAEGGHEGVKVGYKGKEIDLGQTAWELNQVPIDPEVEEMVLELNYRGFETTGSCSGHGEKNAYIIFPEQMDSLQRDDVKELLEGLGARGLRFKNRQDDMVVEFQV